MRVQTGVGDGQTASAADRKHLGDWVSVLENAKGGNKGSQIPLPVEDILGGINELGVGGEAVVRDEVVVCKHVDSWTWPSDVVGPGSFVCVGRIACCGHKDTTFASAGLAVHCAGVLARVVLAVRGSTLASEMDRACSSSLFNRGEERAWFHSGDVAARTSKVGSPWEREGSSR